MKKVLIVTGGRADKNFIETVYKEYSPKVLIAVDRGLMAIKEVNLVPDYIVGDFDSVDTEILDFFRSQFEKLGKPVFKSFNPEKDETDTELAISLAISLNPSDVLILGATGTRLDHVVANIEILYKLLLSGIRASIVDEYNLISLHDSEVTLKKKNAVSKFFSIIPFTEMAKITIKGAKYELDNYELSIGSSLGISNEYNKETVKITVKNGVIILFQSGDTLINIKGNI